MTCFNWLSTSLTVFWSIQHLIYALNEDMMLWHLIWEAAPSPLFGYQAHLEMSMLAYLTVLRELSGWLILWYAAIFINVVDKSQVPLSVPFVFSQIFFHIFISLVILSNLSIHMPMLEWEIKCLVFDDFRQNWPKRVIFRAKGEALVRFPQLFFLY